MTVWLLPRQHRAPSTVFLARYSMGLPETFVMGEGGTGTVQLEKACENCRKFFFWRLKKRASTQTNRYISLKPLPSFCSSSGHEEVVRVFLDGGMEAIGGLDGCLETALRYTMPDWRTKITRMLLAAEGPEGEHRWANSTFRGVPLLHTAAAYNALPIIGVLLRARADETAIAPTGETAHGAVGYHLREDPHLRGTGDPAEKAAVHRMLAQGPAFRARSFLWPTADDDDDNGGCVVEGGGGGEDAAAVPSRSEARDVVSPERIWRPKRKEFLMRLISR